MAGEGTQKHPSILRCMGSKCLLGQGDTLVHTLMTWFAHRRTCAVLSCGVVVRCGMLLLPWQRGVLLRVVGWCPVPLPQSPCPPSPRLSPTRDAVSLVGCTPCSRGTPLLPAPSLACDLSRCGPRRVLVHCWEGWMYCCLHSHLCTTYRCSCCVVPGLYVASHVGTAFCVGKGGGPVGQYARCWRSCGRSACRAAGLQD